jgi:phosphoesterase RecJ-like protein
VQAALLFSETNDGAKISFRSEAHVGVDDWARSFGGGGHRNAAGAYVKRPTFEEAIEDVIEAAPRYVNFENPATQSDGLSAEDQSYLETLMSAKSD